MEQYTVSTAGTAISQVERAQQRGNMREAIRQGHKFIKVKLTEKYEASATQSEVKFNGVKTVFTFQSGRGKGNVPKYSAQVRGGFVTFWWKEFEDPTKDGFYADLLDDKEPAKYDDVGYNRDFLASHLESGWFKIIDPKVVHDVKARAKKISEVVEKQKEEKIQDKETRLKSLKEKKQMLEDEIRLEEEQNADNQTGS